VLKKKPPKARKGQKPLIQFCIRFAFYGCFWPPVQVPATV
jgi:hypothetical protein